MGCPFLGGETLSTFHYSKLGRSVGEHQGTSALDGAPVALLCSLQVPEQYIGSF
jgi:hypothetical protein